MPLIFDTPTPPSQIYSYSNTQVPTSIRPRSLVGVIGNQITSTVRPPSRLRNTVMPTEYDDNDGDDDGSSFSTGSELERDRYRQQHRQMNKKRNVAGAAAPQYADENENPDTLQSLGYGDAGLGFNNKDDNDRFLDLQPVRVNTGKLYSQAQHKRTRVDDHSDATPSGETSSSDDEFSLRLGMRKQTNTSARPVTASTPHPRTAAGNHTAAVDNTVGAVSYSNVSKSAFDGMARELRKEFERIMEMSPAVTHANITRRNTTMPQQPVSPIAKADFPAVTAQGTGALPSAKKRVTVMPTASNMSPDKRQRTFGQELPIYGQPSTAKRIAQTVPFKPAVPPSVSPFRAAVNNVRSQPPMQRPAYPNKDAVQVTGNLYAQGYNQNDHLQLPDVTGVTDAVTSPSRVTSGPSTHRGLPDTYLGSQLIQHTQQDPALSSALSSLRRKLELLESENAESEARVAELESRLAAPVPPINTAVQSEELVTALRGEISRLQDSIQKQSRAFADLQHYQTFPEAHMHDREPRHAERSSHWLHSFEILKDSLSTLSNQICDVKNVLEDIIHTISVIPAHDAGDARLFGQLDPAHADLQRGHFDLHPPQAQRHESAPGPTQHRFTPYHHVRPQSAPVNGIAYRVQRAQQSQVAEAETLLQRAERIISSVSTNVGQHDHTACAVCRKQALEGNLHAAKLTNLTSRPEQHPLDDGAERDGFARPQQTRPSNRTRDSLPMQTVVSRTLRDLEDDFEIHKRIYIELSDEYKAMDPAMPDIGKRRVLANHLKESIDVLEAKADEIKRLYDVLHYTGSASIAAHPLMRDSSSAHEALRSR